MEGAATLQCPHTACMKRLLYERSLFISSTIPCLGLSHPVLLTSGRIQWILKIPGPPCTAYQDHIYELQIDYNSSYPFVAPYLLFITPLFHPNITPTGRMSTIMTNTWNPHDTVTTIYEDILHILANPIKEYPYNEEAVELYYTKPYIFYEKVQYTYNTRATSIV
jgi:ubiquitin-protein ligase